MFQPYVTIADYATDEFVERKSRFIGHIMPVKTEEEALGFLAKIRAENREARHNVFAYILRDLGIKRMSDDGEPQGTGGVPVLEVLEREGLTDVCVVVTRYFGGILLGTGGLVRAYSHGAKIAVDAARKMHMNPCTILTMQFGYDWYGKIGYILPQYNAQTLESDFGAEVSMKIMMTSDKVPAFLKDVQELSSAQVVPKIVEEVCADLE